MTGDTLSHYRLLDRIGQGATSVVYKAEDLALGRPVALKLLPAGLSLDFGVIARFQHEARTTSSLTHPNICTIYETGEHGGRHFIVMEFLEGQVLSNVISGRALDCYRLLEIGIQIADGLAAAHAEGVIHQDIKPANIYVTQHDHVKLLDFGLAVLMPANFGEPGSTSASAVWLATTGGTAPYMSPEQTYGEQLDPRSDLFSFGVTLYEMATGRRPFSGGTNAALMEAIRMQTPPRSRNLNPSVPEELDRIIEKALEKNRKLRYQTALDMGADLRRLKRDLDTQNMVFVPPPGVTAPRPGPVAPAHRLRGDRRLVAGVAAAAVVTIVYGGVRSLGSARTERSMEPLSSASGDDVPLPPVTAVGAGGTARHGTVSPERNGTGDRGDGTPPGAAGAAMPNGGHDGASGDDLVPAEDGRDAPDRQWARQQLAAARSKIDLELYDQAIGTLEALVSKDSRSDEALEAYLLMASIHEARDEREDAIATYLDISSRYPASARAPEALVRMADALLRSRRRDKEEEALKVYTGIAERYPSSAWTARALMAKGELEERMRLYRRDDVLGTAVPSALVTYRHLTETYPASAEREPALWKLSQLYQRVKRFDLAADALAALGEEYPASPHDGWFAAGEIYEKRLKEPSNARSAYARVPTSSPKFEEAQKRLGRR